jgi:tRNA 2-thiouridine synthesizing protein A
MGKSDETGASGPIKPHRQLDTSGTLCPIPVVRARQALDEMQPGQMLEVTATDPLAELDLAVMCERIGHAMISTDSREGVLRVIIRVGPGAAQDKASSRRC